MVSSDRNFERCTHFWIGERIIKALLWQLFMRWKLIGIIFQKRSVGPTFIGDRFQQRNCTLDDWLHLRLNYWLQHWLI